MTSETLVCGQCGAAVADYATHRAWHASLTRTRCEIDRTRDEVEHLEELIRESSERFPGLPG